MSMYDPLQAVQPLQDGLQDKLNASGLDSSTITILTPPATPSKSKISSRPGPWQRPRQEASSSQLPKEQSEEQPQQQQSPLLHSQLNLGYRSPLAPRPPLPGQAPRPNSPSHFQQIHQQHIPYPHQSQLQSQDYLFSSDSPNAWATSPPIVSTSNSPFSPSKVFPQRYSASGQLPVASPVGFASPKRGTSPGLPRSPIAEQSQKPILSLSQEHDSTSEQRLQQLQQPRQRSPPFIKIRVQSIDRAKKELGIKMDAQTNIPTYHRHTSSAFSRTYAEFTSLHAALSANHPETILPALPLAQTSATSEEEEDRFLKVVFQKFMDRVCSNKSVVLDDELREFTEADFGYTPVTRAKKSRSAPGFLSRSPSKPTSSEDGEPDFLVTSKIHSAALEASLNDSNKCYEKALKASTVAASSFAELSSTITSFSTTETHLPLSTGLKQMADAMRTIAELEIGQSNATALVLGDALAYGAVEARSAKDALLQRQYNLDDLHSSIKATITKRRNIEKLRGASNIKPERVNEALDDLEEAQKSEQTLQARVLAISTNLRPALQTHLTAMNEDLLSTLLHHARNQSAYESRKLVICEGIYEKMKNISNKGNGDVVYYHQPQTQRIGTATLQNVNGSSNALVTSIALPEKDEKDLVTPAALTSTTSDAQNRFLEREAQIKAHLRAQQAALQQQQEQKPQRQTLSAPISASPSLTGLSAPKPQTYLAATPMLTPVVRSEDTSDKSESKQSHEIPRTADFQVSQSMFVPKPPSSMASTMPILRSPPASPSRVGGSVPSLRQTQPQQAAFDPLSSANISSASVVSRQSSESRTTTHAGTRAPPANVMAQSVFLPGKSANAGRKNLEEDRKRTDARKAATLLAGAF